MTPSEHLQAAKEALAKKYGYSTWRELFRNHFNVIDFYLDEASLLALTNQAEELSHQPSDIEKRIIEKMQWIWTKQEFDSWLPFISKAINEVTHNQ